MSRFFVTASCMELIWVAHVTAQTAAEASTKLKILFPDMGAWAEASIDALDLDNPPAHYRGKRWFEDLCGRFMDGHSSYLGGYHY